MIACLMTNLVFFGAFWPSAPPFQLTTKMLACW